MLMPLLRDIHFLKVLGYPKIIKFQISRACAKYLPERHLGEDFLGFRWIFFKILGSPVASHFLTFPAKMGLGRGSKKSMIFDSTVTGLRIPLMSFRHVIRTC